MDTTMHVRSRGHLTIVSAARALLALGLRLCQALPLLTRALTPHCFILVNAGHFPCGFHIAFLATYLGFDRI